jgi:hypothetical protein
VPLLNLRMAHVSALIDVNRLAELSFMKRENGTLRVGALTRHRQVEISAEVHAVQPLLPRAAVEVGLRQTTVASKCSPKTRSASNPSGSAISSSRESVFNWASVGSVISTLENNRSQ